MLVAASYPALSLPYHAPATCTALLHSLPYPKAAPDMAEKRPCPAYLSRGLHEQSKHLAILSGDGGKVAGVLHMARMVACKQQASMNMPATRCACTEELGSQ